MPDTRTLRLLRIVRRLFPALLRARLRILMVQWLDLSWRLPSGVALRIASYDDWIVYNEIFVNREYDPAISKALESPSRTRPLCIVDLGANVGFFTLRVVDLLRQSPTACGPFTITLVEGHPNLVAALHSRVMTENGLSDHVRIVHGLIGERAGTATLYEEDPLAGSSIFAGTAHSGLQVDYVDLSPLFALEQEIDLLKCDIEGAELRLIENYPDIFQKVRVAVFELHDLKCNTQQCRHLLGKLGFTHQMVLRQSNPPPPYSVQNQPCSIYCVWR